MISTFPLRSKAWLFAKIQIGGLRRQSEVRTLKKQHINWRECSISFSVGKSKGKERKVKAFYEDDKEMWSVLRILTSESEEKGSDFIFSHFKDVARPINRNLPYNWYRKAWRECKMHIKSGTHVFRSYGITTLLNAQVPLNDIAKVTGHTRFENIAYYDTSDDLRNPTRKFKLTQ